MPCRWALEWGQDQGEMIARAMEDKVGGANLPLDGGGTSTSDKERNQVYRLEGEATPKTTEALRRGRRCGQRKRPVASENGRKKLSESRSGKNT